MQKGSFMMKGQAKKVAILVEEIFNDLEFWYPYYRLKEAEVDITVIGSEAGKKYRGKYGTYVTPDTDAATVSVESLDGIVIPGGYAPDHMRRNPAMVQLVKNAVEQGKLVAAICHGGWMLASAKILKGRTVTAFFSIKDDLEHAGAKFVDDEVVVDGNIITSRTPDDLPAFMKAFLSNL
jgi:protease I